MKKVILISLLTGLIFSGFIFPAPEAQAMEPVTIALLAPVALKVLQVAAPYIIKGLKNLGVGLIEMGVELITFFRFFIGLAEISFLGPFGYFDEGLLDIVEGGIAPAKLILHALTLPIRPFGAFI